MRFFLLSFAVCLMAVSPFAGAADRHDNAPKPDSAAETQGESDTLFLDARMNLYKKGHVLLADDTWVEGTYRGRVNDSIRILVPGERKPRTLRRNALSPLPLTEQETLLNLHLAQQAITRAEKALSLSDAVNADSALNEARSHLNAVSDEAHTRLTAEQADTVEKNLNKVAGMLRAYLNNRNATLVNGALLDKQTAEEQAAAGRIYFPRGKVWILPAQCCQTCQTSGKIKCPDCKNGKQHIPCPAGCDHGVGVCPQCNGSGEANCLRCNGEGIIAKQCRRCNSTGYVVRIQSHAPVAYADIYGTKAGVGGSAYAEEVPCPSCSGSAVAFDTCPACKGSGRRLCPKTAPCRVCNGKGEAVFSCEKCKGSGELTCPSCNGRGYTGIPENENPTSEEPRTDSVQSVR